MSAVVADGDGHPLAHVAFVKGDGDTWTADVDLASVEFPLFEAELAATVKGVDEAGNEVTAGPTRALAVTRLKWKKSLATAEPSQLWSPAVLKDGTVVVAAADAHVYFVEWNGVRATTVGTNGLSGPPAAALDAVWVGSRDGSLYPVSFDGVVGRACTLGGEMRGPPAMDGTWAIASGANAYLVSASSSGVCLRYEVAPSGPPSVTASGLIAVPSAGRLRTFSVRQHGVLREEWIGSPGAPQVGAVSQPLAVDVSNAVWAVAPDGGVTRTSSPTESVTLTAAPPLPSGSTGAVILNDGSAVLGARDVLRRVSAGPALAWTVSERLRGDASIPLVLGGMSPSLLVSTSNGYVSLVSASDGKIVWSERLTAQDQSLETPNIWTDPGATTSTAYFAGADGTLYAIIVDGALDTSAPWPKAYHDPQNTSSGAHAW